MQQTVPRPTFADLAAALHRRAPQLIDGMVDEIRSEMAVYGGDALVDLDELRRSVEDNFATALQGLVAPDAPDLTAAARTGRLRAEAGMPLPEILRAFRIGFRQLWRAIVGYLLDVPEGQRPAPALLAEAADLLWHLTDEYATALTAAYRETTAAHARAFERRRMALVEALFTGGAVTRGQLWDIAYTLELPVDGPFLVAVSDNPRLGQPAHPGVEERLREIGRASAWRLTPDRQLGVIALGEDAGEADVLAVLRADEQARTGVSPRFEGLDGAARALRLARAAVEVLPVGRGGLSQLDSSPLTQLLAFAPEAGRRLTEQVLGPVLELPTHERDLLITTLQAWFVHRGVTDRVAAALFCHPNTVRHRLRRISTELGRSLQDPADVADLGAALRAFAAAPPVNPAR